MPEGPAGVSVLIADGQPILRSGLREVLSAEPDLSVVAEAGAADEILREGLRHQPDVINLDLQICGDDVEPFIADLITALPAVAVVVITSFADDRRLISTLQAGARAYLTKSGPLDDIVRAVRSVAAGGVYFGAEIAESVLRLMRSSGRGTPIAGLTPREVEVLDLIASGLGNGVIARMLYLAPKTVGNHVSNIFAKLGAADRSEAIAAAHAVGLGLGAIAGPATPGLRGN
ncbi:response regulator transcription factor [Kribbella sp. NBC_01505]|uniref:LuxR C-terminal-related transcriptional regulator n=1 Tax=Kribbella sp. NBC_01505 TaxID=2903580 RepID=UPI00386A1AB8